MRFAHPFLLLSAAVVTGGMATAARPVIDRLDDLPRHTYELAEPPSQLVLDSAAFSAVALPLRRDLEADLAQYDIRDRATLQRFKATLFNLAVLAGEDARARTLLADMRSLEEKPSLKLTTGLTTEAWLDTKARHLPAADVPSAFQKLLAGRTAALPWDLVQNDLRETRSSWEIRSAELTLGNLHASVDPAAKSGHVSQDIAMTLVAARYQLSVLLPLKHQIVAALAGTISAHKTVMKDLWTRRLVTLAPTEKASPVLIGIWDSGSDPQLFKDILYTDAAGRHGFAYDLHSNPVPDLLMPLGDAAARLPQNLDRLKGFMDLQAGIDSPESGSIKQYMSALKRDQVKPTLEDLDFVGNYSHGTHVTGIATAGNPFARVVVGRITYDYHLIPETPTLAQARKDAAAYGEQVAYFRDHGVRVVNMSWGGSLREVEDALEANSAGGTPEQRAKLARQIFEIDRDALLASLKGAPNVLFVAAAGNSDNNVKFDEFIPSSFQLPNMITVGAVDSAGAETSFSSFGPMVNVHANGYEVESYVPGGRRMNLSGTSMAAPQVTNLAGKLFALDPKLSVAQAKALILEGCEKQGRTYLISPIKSVQLLRSRMAGGEL